MTDFSSPPKDFPPGTKPREIFVYTCGRIAEPLQARGFKYRKSKNDIVRDDARFHYAIWFVPSIKRGSTFFSAHVGVESSELSGWRLAGHGQQGPELSAARQLGANTSAGHVVSTTLARLTRREDDYPHYDVGTLIERERSIKEVSEQIAEFALPFFARFENVETLVETVKKEGFLPHRKKSLGFMDKRWSEDFVGCFARREVMA